MTFTGNKYVGDNVFIACKLQKNAGKCCDSDYTMKNTLLFT